MRKWLSKIFVTIIAVFSLCTLIASAAEFSDIPRSGAMYEAVKNLTEAGVIAGYEDGSFRPEREITRTEFAALLARTLGYGKVAYSAKELPFTDVPSGYWGENVISFCYENGLINGMGDSTFAPAQKVKYEQAVKMVVCAAGLEKSSAVSGGSEWYSGYVNTARKYGLLDNVDFSAGENANRGNVAVLVYNAKAAGFLKSTAASVPSASASDKDTSDKNMSNNSSDKVQEDGGNLDNGSKDGDTDSKKDFSEVKTILVDAGHNYDGMDTGARNEELGIKEEIVTWQIADKLRENLVAAGYKVVMTRESVDSNISNTSTTDSLRARVDLAHETDADLFISIHCNTGGGKGCETYCFSMGGYAARLAQLIQNEIKDKTDLTDRGVKTANFYVIKNTVMPAVLVETGFIDNEKDAEFLTSEEGQNKIAAAIASAVAKYTAVSPTE